MVLISDSWFIITALIAPSYNEPSFKKSKVSELLCGESALVLKTFRDWVFVQQDDGYKSWVKTFYGYFQDKPFNATHMISSKGDLPFGTRILIKDDKVNLPKNEQIKINQKTIPLFSKPKPNKIISLARSLIGCPYRWGGKSSLGFDCSGFIQMVYFASGICVPRDSIKQRDYFSDAIIKIEDSEPGDIHIFGTKGIINHVGFSTGGYGIIHCQGWVKEESLDADKNNFNKTLRDNLVSTHSLSLKFYK